MPSEITLAITVRFMSGRLVKKYDEDMPSEEDEAKPEFKPECIKSGDLIRLEHEFTARNLHSHRHPAPVTKRHFQVRWPNSGHKCYN